MPSSASPEQRHARAPAMPPPPRIPAPHPQSRPLQNGRWPDPRPLFRALALDRMDTSRATVSAALALASHSIVHVPSVPSSSTTFLKLMKLTGRKKPNPDHRQSRRSNQHNVWITRAHSYMGPKVATCEEDPRAARRSAEGRREEQDHRTRGAAGRIRFKTRSGDPRRRNPRAGPC